MIKEGRCSRFEAKSKLKDNNDEKEIEQHEERSGF